MLNNSGENRHPFLIPGLGGNDFNFFETIKYDVGYGFVIYSLYYVRHIHSLPSFIRAFIIKWC
jgi:hypothetical protein